MNARRIWALVVLVVLASCVGGKTLETPDTSCPTGTQDCGGGTCRTAEDLKSDSANCGHCGNQCPAGQGCSLGQCSSCPQGGLMCNGVCVIAQSDPSNCGGCGLQCGSSQTCTNGACSCSVGSACQKTCVDLQTDNNNCGVCIKKCNTGETCTAGACACNAGLTSCSSACVNTMSDGANCGACGMACAGGQVCDGTGKCGTTCASGTTLCPSATGGMTCSNTMTDGSNCGSCGSACAAGQTCMGGACTCGAGLQLCGGSCSNPMSDNANCGGCGNPCTGGRTCSAGVCSCNTAGQTFCDPSCVSLGTDNLHCGTTCANAVACTGVGQTCANGACSGGGGAGGAGGTSGAGGGGAGGAGAGGAGTGGGGTGGATGERPTGCPAVANVVSDFEEAQVRADKGAIATAQQGRQGWWYTSADTTSGYTPASVTNGPVLAASLTGDASMSTCNQYAFHATATGHTTWGAVTGVPFAAILPPPAAGQKTKNPVDVSAFSGISFKIKLGSGSSPVLAEMQNVETSAAPDGTGMNDSVDRYNTRSKLLAAPDAKRPDRPALSTSWQTVSIPFGTLSPRYLPGGCAAGVICEAPAFNPKSVLGLQFGTYTQYPGNTSAAYDIWVDDVTLYTGDTGLGTYTQTSTGAHKFPTDGAIGSCAKPAGAAGKFLIDAYNRWKANFVVGGRVVSPEIDGGATVSEGIAYGMLISVFMNDKPTFDSLYSYWTSHAGTGGLMNWKYNSSGGVTGNGSAVDADEDAAFALLKADKQWGGYAAPALALIQAIMANDVEQSSGALKLGNSGSGGASLTNPSYFAPAYYRVFATVDTGNASKWNTVISTGYNYICGSSTGCGGGISGSNGLVPAWCSNSCTTRGGGGYTDADMYQYDSHRTPWRLGLDACWNSNAAAKAYVTKTTNFFAGVASGSGVDSVQDIYQSSGTKNTDAQPNSMSCVGSAGVGAMAAGNTNFTRSAWQFVLDATYNSDPEAQKAYTYYNATVGLLTALTLSGNFQNF